MTISATEFKTNIGKYFSIVGTEDICITKNGKLIAKLVGPTIDDQLKDLRSIIGITADNPITLDEIRQERLSKQCL